MWAGLKKFARRLLLLGGLGIALWLVVPLSPKSLPYSFEISSGRSFRGVSRDLADQGLLVFPQLFNVLGRYCPSASHLRAGSYAIDGPVSPWNLYSMLFFGQASQNEVTLVEGITMAQIRQTLQEEESLRHELTTLSDAEVLERLHIDLPLPRGFLRAEGLFRPDTYFFTSGTSDLAILARAYALQKQDLDRLWAERDPTVPLRSSYEALILASIVERETAAVSERPLIAGVFMHRLRLGMRLQTDPTVIYGLGSAYIGKLHHQDMVHDTPWNTYTRDGLPPTPIGLPSREAIEATLHPLPTRALYFVARGNGTHQFSETLKDHDEAIDTFQNHMKKSR